MITPPSSEQHPPIEGTISLGDMPSPEQDQPQETIVVPPNPNPATQDVSGVPFETIPPSASSVNPTPTGKPVSSGPGNPWPKRILMGFIALLVIVGIVFGVSAVLNRKATADKPVTLTYWGLWENDEVIRPVITAFETAHPTIKIQYVKQSQTEYRQRLQAAIDRGEGPDLFRFHNTWIPMLRTELATVPESIMTSTEFQNTFYTVASNDLVSGNTIYGLPLMIDGLGLYYNEDLFAAAGIAGPPTTWEELLAMVPKIAKPQGQTFAVSAIALGTTNNVENYSDILATMFLQNGATPATPTGKEAEETLLFYRKFSTPSDPVYTWNDTMDNSISAFASGKVAMILAPSWRAFEITQMNPNLRFKIAAIPQLPGNSITWASYWVEGVSDKSKNQKEAWEFLKYLTSKEGATLMYSEASKARKLFGEPYARVDMAESVKSDPYVSAFISQAPYAKSFPLASRTHDDGLNDGLITYLGQAIDAVAGGAAPAEALQTMSAGFTQVFTRYGLTTNAAPTSAAK